MTGTTADIIPIVIVPVVALAFCLVMIFRAASHPRWGSQAPADTGSTHALEGSVPAQRLSRPGPVVPGQRPGAAADEVNPRAGAGQQNPTSGLSSAVLKRAAEPARRWGGGRRAGQSARQLRCRANPGRRWPEA